MTSVERSNYFFDFVIEVGKQNILYNALKHQLLTPLTTLQDKMRHIKINKKILETTR